MVCRVLLVKEHKGPESAACIRETLQRALREELKMEFSNIMKRYTFVSDCASTYHVLSVHPPLADEFPSHLN